MSTDMIETLARFVRTDAGRRWFESVDRATRAQQETVAERVELVAAIEETERVEREDVPPLRAAVERADVQLAAARAAFEKAKRRRYETGIAAENLRDRAREDRRRARGRLRLTADPRLAPARDTLLAAAHNWHHAANAMARFETRGEFMEARQVMVNREELGALRDRIDRALERIEVLELLAEPTEDEIVAAVTEAQDAAEPVLGVVRRHFA
jgi:hypothetical protein